jgi:predicted metal-binding protein
MAVALGARKKPRLFRGEEVAEKTLMADLERYQQAAVELGATAAKIIPASWVIVDERARLKCYIPRCMYYGQSPSCPPFTPDVELIRRAFARYRWAILFKIDVIPVEDFTDGTRLQERIGVIKLTSDIAGEVENMAFHDGYHLAIGLGNDGCKLAYCKREPCAVLAGGQCRFPLKARPALEGMAIDVYSLVTKAGWDVYPISRSTDPSSVPSAISVGLVMVW